MLRFAALFVFTFVSSAFAENHSHICPGLDWINFSDPVYTVIMDDELSPSEVKRRDITFLTGDQDQVTVAGDIPTSTQCDTGTINLTLGSEGQTLTVTAPEGVHISFPEQ